MAQTPDSAAHPAPLDRASAFERRILIHYGEIALKGRNRIRFEQALQRSLTHRLRAAGVKAAVELRHDRLCVRLGADDVLPIEDIEALVRGVPGMGSII